MFDSEEVMSVFSEKTKSDNTSLEAHHIIPLGSVKKIGQVSGALRRDVRSIYNSPLNFIYITKKIIILYQIKASMIIFRKLHRKQEVD